MRAAIYARYSSDLSRDASIEDQVRLCRAYAVRAGWEVTQVFEDRAISGASTIRPGYQRLLEAVLAGSIDVVLAEALDRLSRDQEDIAALHKRLRFLGVKLITASEGEIGDLHIGLKGAMNALYLKDLADKTRRGLEGRVRAGRSGGGLCYGYDVVPGDERGGRTINPDEAAIVRRIFAEFAAGRSPKAIARGLNDESVPGSARHPLARHRHPRPPRARHRHPQQRALRRPARLEPAALCQGSRAPAGASRAATRRKPGSSRTCPSSASSTSPSGRRSSPARPRSTPRPGCRRSRPAASGSTGAPHTCSPASCAAAHCGGDFAAVGRDYLACANARKFARCDQRKAIRREVLEEFVLDLVRDRLMQPDAVKTFVAAYMREINAGRDDAEAARGRLQRQLDTVGRKLEGFYDAIGDGLRTPGLLGKIQSLEARQVAARG